MFAAFLARESTMVPRDALHCSLPSPDQGRRPPIWLRAQRLDTPAPFGDGPQATSAAVAHLGYVQIDTINVIERCHHHILWTRAFPDYRRAHLHQAQTVDKSVFEYWTHALSYVPTQGLCPSSADMGSTREPHVVRLGASRTN